LSKAAAKPFAGQIVAVTGGAGAIGLATAKAFAREGAAIALIDFNRENCKAAAASIGSNCLAVVADLTEAGRPTRRSSRSRRALAGSMFSFPMRERRCRAICLISTRNLCSDQVSS
jgi:NAD(P)-dependent dehydrogenase (short-subunit alcohol dehydrogenase family)